MYLFVLSLNIKPSIYRIKTDLAPLLSEVSQRKSELLNFENSINTRKSELRVLCTLVCPYMLSLGMIVIFQHYQASIKDV